MRKKGGEKKWHRMGYWKRRWETIEDVEQRRGKSKKNNRRWEMEGRKREQKTRGYRRVEKEEEN